MVKKDDKIKLSLASSLEEISKFFADLTVGFY